MYKLSNLAAKDFEQIFEYTLLNYGVKQADDYVEGLLGVLLTFSEQPFMGRECPDISLGLRRHDFNRHAIFYRSQGAKVYVVRILHQQMEPLRHFSLEIE